MLLSIIRDDNQTDTNYVSHSIKILLTMKTKKLLGQQKPLLKFFFDNF